MKKTLVAGLLATTIACSPNAADTSATKNTTDTLETVIAEIGSTIRPGSYNYHQAVNKTVEYHAGGRCPFIATQAGGVDRVTCLVNISNNAYKTVDELKSIKIADTKYVLQSIKNADAKYVPTFQPNGYTFCESVNPYIGMSTNEAASCSSWGRPNSISNTTRSSGTTSLWIYDRGYLYFDNGILTTINTN